MSTPWPTGPRRAIGRLIGEPGVLSLILSRSYTFLEIDHEIFSNIIRLLIQERLQGIVCA